jgi:non-heme chloroperoxidase
MLKTYAGYPHGMATTHADEINADILAFIRGEPVGQSADAAPSVVIEPLSV